MFAYFTSDKIRPANWGLSVRWRFVFSTIWSLIKWNWISFGMVARLEALCFGMFWPGLIPPMQDLLEQRFIYDYNLCFLLQGTKCGSGIVKGCLVAMRKPVTTGRHVISKRNHHVVVGRNLCSAASWFKVNILIRFSMVPRCGYRVEAARRRRRLGNPHVNIIMAQVYILHKLK